MILTPSFYKKCILAFLLFSINVYSLKFNTNEITILEGKHTTLSDDEGYLLLSLENFEKIDNFIIKPVKSGNKVRFNKVLKGENFALIKLKAGEYYWDFFMYYFTSGTFRVNYKKMDHTFKVEAGKINYPGTWSADIKFTGFRRAYQTFDSINKSAYELNKLRKRHKAIYNQYPFKFQGTVEDNYSNYYKEISNLYTPVPKEKNVVSYDITKGISAELKSYGNIKAYLKDHNQSVGNFNPNGRYLLFKTVIDDVSMIKVLNLSNYQIAPIFQKKLPKDSYVNEVKWIDNDSIYYSVYYDGVYNKRITHLKINKDHELIGAEHLKIPTQGALIDPLVNQNNKVYIAKNSIYSNKKNGIYKVDVSDQKSINKSIKKPFKTIKKLKDAVYWLTAGDGEIRFIITSEYNKKNDSTLLSYWFLPAGKDWMNIYTITSEQDIEVPKLISKDQKYLYVVTNKYSDKMSIQKYSTENFSHEGSFYENDDIEIVGLKVDPLSNDIIGVLHVENGFYKIKYFERQDDSLMALRNKYPGHNFYIAQQNTRINKILVYGTNEYSKGSWSIYDTNTHVIDKLFELNPSYSKLEKGVFHNINIKAGDGINLEGYLVTPNTSKSSQFPLIVIPHGGPIGIRDYAYNSDIQHFYASQGVATLKVNYRGSGGFGKKFQKSGQKQWGEKIESDINEMVDHIIENYNISANKICTMGSSYGGYSAIMLTILYPDRYKCAVSLAGVTDIPLMFTSSDFKNDEKSIEGFKDIVGDPLNDSQGLINKSPLYLVDKITKPILLFHGASDKRVTPEHSIRIKEILDMANKKSELIILENEEHSLNNIESKIVYIARSLDFIKKNLLIE